MEEICKQNEENNFGGFMGSYCINIHGKETSFVMWKVQSKSSENNSDHMKLELKNKLRSINLQKNDTILQYLSRFTQCHDELGQVGFTVV